MSFTGGFSRGLTERQRRDRVYVADRVRTFSETSSENGDLARKVSTGVGYDVDGKFSFTKVRSEGRGGCQKVSYNKYLVVKVLTGAAITIPKTTVDENGKFSYYSADMRPVPPGRKTLSSQHYTCQ